MGLLLRSLAVVGLLSLLWSAPARAVTYQSITLEVGPTGSLDIHNETHFNLGAVAILTTGATGFAFNAALPGLSLPDSVFTSDFGVPPYSLVVANNTAFGVSLVPAFSQGLLGTFQIANPSAFGIFPADDIAGGTLFDAFYTLSCQSP
jgi:hypothetical protein